MTGPQPIPTSFSIRVARAGAAALAMAALLASCSLAPRYQRPEAPVAAAFPGAAADEKAGTPAADIGWREFFTDARLQALIASALENNRDLRVAALRMEEARALYNIQSADRLPNLNLGASGSRARTPLSATAAGAAVPGADNASIVTSNYQVGLSLSAFELDFFGRVRSLSEAALEQYLATEEARRAAQIAIVAEVAKAYLAERAFAEQLSLAEATLKGRQSSYELAQKRFEVGASSALDLRQNEILALGARISSLSLRRQRAQAENVLTSRVSKPLADLPPGLSLSEQKTVAEIPAGLPSDLLNRRPDIRAAEQRLKSANANIGAARAAFFPRISLTAGIGTASNELSNLFEAGTRTWSFMPQMLLPLFDAGRNSSNLNLAHARSNIAVAEYEKSIQVAFREVADALAARATLNEEADAQRAVQEAQAERLRLADLRFQNGVASSLDLLDAQRELYSAQQALIQTRLLRLTNAIDLYRGLGGGLNENTVAQAAPGAKGDTKAQAN